MLVSFWYTFLNAQQSTPQIPQNIVVLEKQLEKSSLPSEKLDLICQLAESYLFVEAEKATTYGRQALTMAKDQKDQGRQCKMLTLLGKSQLVTSNYVEAINHFVRAKAQALPRRDTLLTDICNGLGIAYQYFQEFDIAITEFQRGIQYAKEQQQPQKALYPLGNLADLFRQRGEFGKARDFLNRAKAFAIRSEEERDMGFVCKDLSFLYIKLGKLDSARILVRQAINITEVQYPYIACDAYVNLSIINRLEGRHAQALEFAEKGKALALQVNAKKFASRADLAIIQYHQKLGNYEKALEAGVQAVNFAEQHQLNDEAQKIYQVMGQIYGARKQFRQAYETQMILDSLQSIAFNRDREKRATLAEYRLKTNFQASENQLLKEQLNVGEYQLRQSNLFALALFFFSAVAFLCLYYLFQQGYFKDPEISQDFMAEEEASRLHFVKQMTLIGCFLVTFLVLYLYFQQYTRGFYFGLAALGAVALNYFLATRGKLKAIFSLNIVTFYTLITAGIYGLYKLYSMPLAILAAFIQISFLGTRISQQILNLVIGIGVFTLCLYRLFLAPDQEAAAFPQIQAGLEFMVALISLIVIVATVVYFSRNIIAFKSQLWKSNQFLTQIANINPHFIFAKNTDRKFTFANRALCDTVGIPQQKLMGKRDEDIHPVYSHDRHFMEDDLEVLETGKTKYRKEEKIRDQFNREKWMSTIKKPIRNDQGEIVGLLGVATDITENKKQQEVIARQLADLNQKNKELKKYIESNMELENFAYIASHDLRAPVRTLISFSQLLEKSLQGKLEEREQEYLHFIKSASSNMNQLINDLLTYSRINNAQVNIEEVDLRRLLEELTTEMRAIIDEKFARIQIGELPAMLYGDPTKLRQLFQNLIANALKFSKNNVRPQIRIIGKEDPGHWKFIVQDNGIGINKEFYQRIFLLFQRLHSQDQIEGTGIGLALCKKIIDQHQGSIWVESEEGIGTSFFFTISKDLQPEVVNAIEV